MRLLTALLLLAIPSALPAQGNGVTKISQVDQYSYYNDIWGYTAPDGREYAILGTGDGTAIYNCTNPAAPYRTGFIAGQSSTWRDMKTYGHFVYVVTEGGPGVQIINLLDPENPVLVKRWGDSVIDHAHNIAIDTDTGLAYVSGSHNGTPVLDLSSPKNPVHIATYGAFYVHDLHVQDGLAHLAEIYEGRYRIVSVDSLPSFPSLDSIKTPGDFTHTAWVNESNTIAVTTDESSGGRLTIYDVANPNNIIKLSTFTLSSSTIVHNAFIRGSRIYASWYTRGFACVDISDPSNPSLVGSYDTSTRTGQYDGAWGCYPFAPSGHIYVSDQDNGLFILKVDDDTETIALTGDTAASTGQTVSYEIQHAPTLSSWWLVRSFSQNGSVYQGHDFNVGNPLTVLYNGTTDEEGKATFTSAAIPSSASGLTLYLEAAATKDGVWFDSDPLTLVIQ
ncbi:MAG: choice-of-anchor B family protein [Planctomycetes bacterium]|nr:choice-of-anchor B family protein [Planctomycetota bacterium]